MCRLILVAIVFVIFFTLTLPVYLLLLLIGLFQRNLCTRIAQPIVTFGFRMVLCAAGVRVIVKGKNHIPDESVLFATNHRSIADIPIIYTTVPHLTGIVAKKEIKKIPLLSWWMKLVNCLFLDRDNMKKAMKTILDGIEIMKSGYSMCIMPEGTRNHKQELLPFKEGSFKMAEKTGSPIVPVAIWKTDEIFELHMPFVKRTTVTIQYGEAIRVTEMSREEQKRIGTLVRSRIEEMLSSI